MLRHTSAGSIQSLMGQMQLVMPSMETGVCFAQLLTRLALLINLAVRILSAISLNPMLAPARYVPRSMMRCTAVSASVYRLPESRVVVPLAARMCQV
jgi:hypothetical protein